MYIIAYKHNAYLYLSPGPSVEMRVKLREEDEYYFDRAEIQLVAVHLD